MIITFTVKIDIEEQRSIYDRVFKFYPLNFTEENCLGEAYVRGGIHVNMTGFGQIISVW